MNDIPITHVISVIDLMPQISSTDGRGTWKTQFHLKKMTDELEVKRHCNTAWE